MTEQVDGVSKKGVIEVYFQLETLQQRNESS